MLGVKKTLSACIVALVLLHGEVGLSQQREVLHELELIADDLLNGAIGSYRDGDYWACARDLIILVDFHPQYSKLATAEVLLGNALYELELYEAAKGTFQHVLDRFPEKASAVGAIFGLERVAYKSGQYAEALGHFEHLKRRTRPGSKVLEGGRYFAGLSLLEMGDYENALSVLLQVNPHSPYYGYALYSAGIACLKKRDIQQALEIFERLASLPVTSERAREVVGEARLTLGYVYYELGYLQRAMDRFRSVYPDHAKRQDALIGYAWAAYKAGDYEETIRGCTELVTKFPDTKYLEEALFVLGRSLIESRRYDDAIRVFDRLISLYPEGTPKVSEEDRANLDKLRSSLEKLRLRLLVLESRLLQVLPGETASGANGVLRERLHRIRKKRTEMLAEIRREREQIDSLDRQVEILQREVDRLEGAPDWKAYAEYGRARALFLKQNSQAAIVPK